MKTPCLVQRGKFKTPEKIEGIDSLIHFDYMGSAEFEFGALPKALKEICAVFSQLKVMETDIKTEDDRQLWLLCKPEDEPALQEFWHKAVNDRYSVRTKELLWYGKDIKNDRIGGDDTEFWWDIGEKQCWMAALGWAQIEDVWKALEAVKKKKGW